MSQAVFRLYFKAGSLLFGIAVKSDSLQIRCRHTPHTRKFGRWHEYSPDPGLCRSGITEVHAAGLLALIWILDLFGTTLSGWLSDRCNSRYFLCWYCGLRGLSLLGLPCALSGPEWGLSAFAIFYGLDWIAIVPPRQAHGRVVGRASVGVMFSWIIASHQVGAALAATFAGSVRTYLGDYMIAILLSE